MRQIYDYHLVTISGPQGCGKTTTMNALKELVKDEPILVDDFKVSRMIQDNRGSDLASCVKDVETMLEFQRAILSARIRYEDDVLPNNAHGNKIIVMERGFADIAAYAKLWAEKLNADAFYSALVDEFVESCRTQARFTSLSLYLPAMPHVKFEDDPNRAASTDVDRFNTLLVNEMNTDAYCNKTATITGVTPEERAACVLNQIKYLL